MRDEMKTIGKINRKVNILLLLSLLLPTFSHGAVMNDYCIVPPFIAENVPSNLLLMLDNSSSMYDLSYSDQGNMDSGGAITRQPYYCYDETYQTNVCSGDSSIHCSVDTACVSGQTCSHVYAGYFD